MIKLLYLHPFAAFRGATKTLAELLCFHPLGQPWPPRSAIG
jgi:hypothetical protein